MKTSKMYLFFAILGAAIPYYFFIPFVQENGLDIPELIRQLFANRISSFFGVDVLISAVVLLYFISQENQKKSVRYVYWSVIGTLLVGVSFGLPLFLYLRERSNAHNPM